MPRSSKSTNKTGCVRFGRRSRDSRCSKNVASRSLNRSLKEWGTLMLQLSSRSGSSSLFLKVRRTLGPRSTAANPSGLSSIDSLSEERLGFCTSSVTVPKRRTLKRSTYVACLCIAALTACVTISKDGTTRRNATVSQILSILRAVLWCAVMSTCVMLVPWKSTWSMRATHLPPSKSTSKKRWALRRTTCRKVLSDFSSKTQSFQWFLKPWMLGRTTLSKGREFVVRASSCWITWSTHLQAGSSDGSLMPLTAKSKCKPWQSSSWLTRS